MSDTIITTTTTRAVSPDDASKGYTLKELCRLLGCEMIEIISAPNGMILVVDEEGRLAGKPLNPAASRIAGQHIVGDALYCDARHVR